MKRLASTTGQRYLPTFGDYRRMRMPEPFNNPTAKEREILEKAAEEASREASEIAEPVAHADSDED